MEDQQAVVRLQGGDLSGLETLVEHHYLTAVRAAYLVVHDRELAEDVVQTSFVNLAEKINQFDSRRPFRPWFMRCVVNAAINCNHRQRKELSLEQQDVEGYFTLKSWWVEQTPAPEEQVEAGENQRAIWQALQQLTPSQRAAVVMRYYLEMSEVEMAQELECSPSSLKWWLYSARRQLRDTLELFKPGRQPNDGAEEQQ